MDGILYNIPSVAQSLTRQVPNVVVGIHYPNQEDTRQICIIVNENLQERYVFFAVLPTIFSYLHLTL